MKIDKLHSNKKILIMAGGTGGHIFPALSIAKYFLEQGIKVEWLGTKMGLEAKVIGETDIPIHFISISGLRGKSVFKKLLSPLFICLAILQAMVKILLIKPNCVLGMGGFVTGPGGVAARLLGKKVLIHEQNAIAGLTNQLLFPLSTVVMEAFPGAFERKQEITTNNLLRAFIKADKAVCVGNPVRKEILDCPEPMERFSVNESAKLKIMIVGGSLGAIAINNVIPAMLSLLPKAERPEVLHQCGKKNIQETLAVYSKLGVEMNQDISVQPFIDDMAKAYCWADVVICRSGAITVSELASVGVASVLIPYPYAVDDHQTENAKVLEQLGAAWVINQDDLSPEKLLSIVEMFMNNKSMALTKALAAKNGQQIDATKQAAKICMEACYA